MADLRIEGRAALIVNECQLGVIDPVHSAFAGLARQAEQRGIVPRIAALAEAFRAKRLPVVHVPVIHRPDFADIKPNSLINALTLKHRRMARGSAEADYIEPLRPRSEDIVIERPAGLIAFNATSLDATLRRLDVQTVVLVGVSTNVAITGCAMAAVDLGYYVIVPEDCIAGADAETHTVLVEQQLRMLARISIADTVARAL